MLINLSYDKEFETLWSDLETKYPARLFEIDGVGRDQLDMARSSKEYFSRNKEVMADISVDANANVSDRSVVSYDTEIQKPFQRLNSYYMLWKYARQYYGTDFANMIVEGQLAGDFYINDFHHFFTRPYCFNYSTYDVALQGLPYINRIKCIPPKHLLTFKQQMEQFTVFASNNQSGASGQADLLIIMSHYVEKVLKEMGDLGVKFNTENDVWRYVSELLTSYIYTINQPFRSNQCVDEETEVLTPNGFKKYYELKAGEDIYTWHNGTLNIQKVQRVNVFDYDGEMHLYKGRDITQCITPNHRVLHKKNNGKEYIIKTSDKLINKKTNLTIPVAMLKDERPDYDISDNMLKLVVWTLTGGYISNLNDPTRQPCVSFFKSTHRWGNSELRTLLKEEGLEYTLSTQKTRFDLSTSDEKNVMIYDLSVASSKKICELLNNNSKELPSWMFKLSRRQAKLVIDLWAKLGGNTDPNAYNRQKLQCDNYIIADQLQHVCFLAGMGSKISTRWIGDNKNPTIYVVLHQRINKDFSSKQIINYKGKVWCPTTDDGVVVFRKNGSIFISGNSAFVNISLYDKHFLSKLCEDIYFDDGTKPNVEIIQKLQQIYLEVMNKELERTPITFPVTTACFSVNEDRTIKDKEFRRLIAKYNLRWGFINIFTGDSSTLSSCCRLRSQANNEYFNSFGAGSTKIGSLGVVTLNMARAALKTNKNKERFLKEVERLTEIACKINNVKRHILRRRIEDGYLPLYTYGYMDLSKQYFTTGLNGLNEAIKFMGEDILKEEGQNLQKELINRINKTNDYYSAQYKAPINCEQTPSENSAVKLAEKDRLLGYQNEVRLYSNQFIPLTTKADMLDRIRLQGMFDNMFSGGAICHLNIEERIDNPQIIEDLIDECAEKGVVYFAINYNLQECANGHMDVGHRDKCVICGADIINDYTRIVGFLTNTKHWNRVRREYDAPFRQFYTIAKEDQNAPQT